MYKNTLQHGCLKNLYSFRNIKRGSGDLDSEEDPFKTSPTWQPYKRQLSPSEKPSLNVSEITGDVVEYIPLPRTPFLEKLPLPPPFLTKEPPKSTYWKITLNLKLKSPQKTLPAPGDTLTPPPLYHLSL